MLDISSLTPIYCDISTKDMVSTRTFFAVILRSVETLHSNDKPMTVYKYSAFNICFHPYTDVLIHSFLICTYLHWQIATISIRVTVKDNLNHEYMVLFLYST
jgi:hypothetical protein